MRCYICNKTLRTSKYELDFIGQVCSGCFRISRKNYIKKVDELAEKRLEYLFLEITKSNTLKT